MADKTTATFFILFVLIGAAILGFLIAWFLRNIKIKKLQAEIDALQAENAKLRSELDGVRAELSDANVEIDRLKGLKDALNSKLNRLTGELDDCNSKHSALSLRLADLEKVDFDAAAASAALGKKIKQDDLTVVEGIGPKISELMNKHGINTWFELSQAPVDKLQAVLDSGGDRFSIHKPGTWAQQAEMAYLGQWTKLNEWQDYLDGGVEPT